MAVCEVDNGMLGFETITFAPFDSALIDVNLMTASEVDWLNQNHSAVQEKLTPFLDSDDLMWLKQATAQI
jgi:Xaa-Pro aminopeptidase